jgi:DNA-binding NarL/FixJ family response regulator
MAGVLIADDNPNIRTLLRTFIETQTGFQICGEAHDGQDAIQKARQVQPDLIMLDLAMPRLNGIEAASILRREMPAVRIILFTLHVDSIGKSLAAVIGIDFVLSKDEPLSKLAEHLNRLQPREVSPTPAKKSVIATDA